MRLVNCIGVIVAELVDNLGDAVMVAFSKRGSDGGLESGDVVSQWAQILCANSCAIILNVAMVRTPCPKSRAVWRAAIKSVSVWNILKSTAFPLVVQLVLQRPRCCGLHLFCSPSAHSARMALAGVRLVSRDHSVTLTVFQTMFVGTRTGWRRQVGLRYSCVVLLW